MNSLVPELYIGESSIAAKKKNGWKSSLAALAQTTRSLSFTDTPSPSTKQNTSPKHGLNVLPTWSSSETSPTTNVVTTLQDISREDSVFESAGEEKSDPPLLLQPQAPTGSEWGRHGRGPVGSESDVAGLQEVLKQLDQQAQ